MESAQLHRSESAAMATRAKAPDDDSQAHVSDSAMLPIPGVVEDVSKDDLVHLDVVDAVAVYASAVDGHGSALQSMRYSRGKLELLDQRRLPHECVYLDIKHAEDCWHAIRDMAVRGAPAIAISAALAMAVELANDGSSFSTMTPDEAVSFITNRLDYLGSSRPTAVNLFEAIDNLKRVVASSAASGGTAADIVLTCIEAAERMLADDVNSNMAIGNCGALAICEDLEYKPENKLRILTHCNTGSLATAGYGTALGVIRSLHSMGKLETAICTETRPYNQGSRLTAFELVHDGIPAILVADSAVASLKAIGRVDAVVVGADRIAANGDTANKIGTYSLALSAFHHGIPFYVAAPLTTVDFSIHSGEGIHIEERSSKELTHAQGGYGAQVAASGIHVWNPAFDITPAQFITAIFTNKGVVRKPAGLHVFDIPHSLGGDPSPFASNGRAASGPSPARARDLAGMISAQSAGTGSNIDHEVLGDQFDPLDDQGVLTYVAKYKHLWSRIGGKQDEWTVKEVGDGNINFVYIVMGPLGGIVLKQSLPYVRCVGESWPLTLERSYFEVSALREHGRHCPQHVPEVFHSDRTMAILAERYCEPPHIILSKGLITGTVYPNLVEHMAEYMSKTLFFTSLLAMKSDEHKEAVAKYCQNFEMCRLTEAVIFKEPYMNATNNRWTTPQLDEDVLSLWKDTKVKLGIAELKTKFCERAQALIHGDLHTGSIMVTQTSTQVIDPEFAFYGPMGFDIGAYIGNLMLAYFSQEGHSTAEKPRDKFKAWLLRTIEDTWTSFKHKFVALWKEHPTGGDAYPAIMYHGDDDGFAMAQEAYMQDLLEDTVGFAAANMIRRIVGIAHVIDLEQIENADVRAACERRVLKFARALLVQRKRIASIQDVVEALKNAE